jgi:hypothetical protein
MAAQAQLVEVDPNMEIIEKIHEFNKYVPYLIIKRNFDEGLKKYYNEKRVTFNNTLYNRKYFDLLKTKFSNYYFQLSTPEGRHDRKNFDEKDIILNTLFSILYNIIPFGVNSDDNGIVNDEGFYIPEVILQDELKIVEFLVAQYIALHKQLDQGLRISDIYDMDDIIPDPYPLPISSCNVMNKYIKYKNKYLALKKQLDGNLYNNF